MKKLFARNTVRWEIDGTSIKTGLLTLSVESLSIYDSPLLFKWVEQENVLFHTRKYFEIDLRSIKFFRILKDTVSSNDPGGSVSISTLENELFLFRFEEGISDFVQILYKWPICQISPYSPLSTAIIFKVTRPFLHSSLCSIHEGSYPIFTILQLEKYKGINRRISNLPAIKRHIFYSGISTDMVQQTWPVLFAVFPSFLNSEEHRIYFSKLLIDYERISITNLRLCIGESEWLNLNRSIEQDVARTDIDNSLFDSSFTHAILIKILIKFVSYNRKVGYHQGMSDIVSVLYSSINTEEITFWCFVKLVKKTPFANTKGKHCGINNFVLKLKELTSIFLPCLHKYLDKIDMGLEFQFSHRWLIVNCRREFSYQDSKAIITAIISSSYDTEFILYICLSLCACHHEELMKTCGTIEDILEYFLNISYTIPINLILQQARGFAYLHNKLTTKKLRAIFH